MAQDEFDEFPETVSPTPSKGRSIAEMSFPDAMREVLNGKSVTRLAWETNDIFGKSSNSS